MSDDEERKKMKREKWVLGIIYLIACILLWIYVIPTWWGYYGFSAIIIMFMIFGWVWLMGEIEKSFNEMNRLKSWAYQVKPGYV